MVRTLVLLVLLSSLAFAEVTDPTRPLDYSVSSHESVQALRLQSILFAEERRIAVINGYAVSVGEQVGSAKVVRISRDKVTVEQGGVTRILRLPKTEVRK